jgi:hypothetical protein
MKVINCNDWAPCSNSDCWTSHNKLSIPIPITDPLLASVDNLYYSLYDEVLFYYILERVVSYNILDEDLYEDD